MPGFFPGADMEDGDEDEEVGVQSSRAHNMHALLLDSYSAIKSPDSLMLAQTAFVSVSRFNPLLSARLPTTQLEQWPPKERAWAGSQPLKKPSNTARTLIDIRTVIPCLQ
jgi:hypothetical protein